MSLTWFCVFLLINFFRKQRESVCVCVWWGYCVWVDREGERMNMYLLGVESICYNEYFSHCGWSPSQTFPHSTPPRLYSRLLIPLTRLLSYLHSYIKITWESCFFFNPTCRYDLLDVFLSLPAFSENALDMCWVSWGVKWWSLYSSSHDAGHT